MVEQFSARKMSRGYRQVRWASQRFNCDYEMHRADGMRGTHAYQASINLGGTVIYGHESTSRDAAVEILDAALRAMHRSNGALPEKVRAALPRIKARPTPKRPKIV